MDKKKVLLKLVEKLDQVSAYADACFVEQRTQSISKDATGLESAASADAGVRIRAFDGERFHNLCMQGFDPERLKAAVQEFAKGLQDLPKGKVSLKIDRKSAEEDFSLTYIEDPRQVSQKTKAGLVEELYRKTRERSEHFINCKAGYYEEEEERVFVSKHKQLSASWTGVTTRILPFVQDRQGQVRYDFLTRFGNGYESTQIDDDDLEEFYQRTLRLRTAGRIAPGKYTVILSPEVSGLLAHESFGHGMEADTMLHGRARASEYLGKRIAQAKVNICEDASLPSTHGFLFFDDEGAIPERVYLVEKGIVRQPITDLRSASLLNVKRTANGRAEGFDRKVYARMTNTFFLAGKDDPKQMIKGIKDGWYLHSGKSGMEDPKGWGVQIAGIIAERIRNGKLTGELATEVTITGFLPDLLKNITGIGKEFSITNDAGFCGKGHKEWVRVSSGGPHLLIEKVELS